MKIGSLGDDYFFLFFVSLFGRELTESTEAETLLGGLCMGPGHRVSVLECGDLNRRFGFRFETDR